MAEALRRREPTTIVFSHGAVNRSYAQFSALAAATRSANENAKARPSAEDQRDWRAFDEHVEELIWATEWLHITLARRPGE